MTFPRLLLIIAIVLFSTIGLVALFKGGKSKPQEVAKRKSKPVEVALEQEVKVVPAPKAPAASPKKATTVAPTIPVTSSTPSPQVSTSATESLPDADRIQEFFNTGGNKLPIVETLIYKSRVDWQKGRPAWLSDYARHYQTSRHFIARSLNGKPDYFKQDIAEGAKFNVLRKDKKFQFHLLVDLSRCKLWFYYDDLDTKERVLLKTYQVGIGRAEGSKPSGFLTPLGQYTLGNKIAIYKPKMMGHHNGESIEMIRIFGTRWIPFDKEIKGCTAAAKGLGIHGVPWSAKGSEELGSLGKYESDGCIRLASRDMEELFAIIITKPTTIEIVKDFHEAERK